MKRETKVILVVCLVCFLILGGAGLKYFTGYEIHRDVAYGEGEANVMDIYIPKRAYRRENNGCVLFIHGGSWMGGDKAEEAIRCRLLASHGYIAATINYTLWSEEIVGEYTVFGVMDEIDQALATLKTFTSEREIEVDKAGISGYSAGAHLAMLYAYARAETAPMEIVFAASMAGPADISADIWGSELTTSIGMLLTGETVTEDMLSTGEADELLASISPISYIDENAPPSIIFHGGNDLVVPIRNATSVVEKLETLGISHDFIYMKYGSHALIENPFRHLTFLKTLLLYCEEYLR